VVKGPDGPGGRALVIRCDVSDEAAGGRPSRRRALRPSWARHQIRVNTIGPGWTDTPMTEVALHGEAFMGPASTTPGDTFAIDGGYVIL